MLEARDRSVERDVRGRGGTGGGLRREQRVAVRTQAPHHAVHLQRKPAAAAVASPSRCLLV